MAADPTNGASRAQFTRSPLVWLLPLMFLLLAAAGMEFGRGLVAARERPMPLVVPARSLEVGSVLAQNALTVSLPITNDSKKRIQISQFRPLCGCASVAPTSLSIGPHETRSIELTIDLFQAASGRHRLRAPFEVGVKAVVAGSDFQSPTWNIKGTVLFPMVLENSQVWFNGADAIGVAAHAREKCIRGRLLDPQTSLVIKCPDEVVAHLIEPNKDGEFEVSLAPAPRATAGHFEYVVEVRLLDGAQNTVYQQPIIVRGEVISSYQFVPRQLSLGFQVASDGSSVTRDVVLRCRREELSFLTADSSDVRADVVGEPDERTLAIRIIVTTSRLALK